MRFAPLLDPYLRLSRSVATASFPHVRPRTPRQVDQFISRSVVSGVARTRRGLVAVNSVLHSLSSGSSPCLAISLYDAVRFSGAVPDQYTLTSALKAAARLGRAEIGGKLHSLIFRLGFEFDTFVQNALIHMYFVRGGSPRDARKVFDSAPQWVVDVVSWNSLISGYVGRNMSKEALWVFGEMQRSSVAMDAMTPVGVLSACAKVGGLETGRSVHALLVVNGIELDFYVGSSLISMYASCGAVEIARKVFDTMPERNLVCWTSIISGYSHSGLFRESIELFREMQAAGVSPDHATIASVLSSCARLGALAQGKYIHACCDTFGWKHMDLRVKNSLMDMYLKCGDVARALSVFDGLARRDAFSWTIVIAGLAINGCSTEALDLFSRMEAAQDEARPNEITFLGVLTACSHGGMVNKGYYYFDSMTKSYNLTPKIEHYGCMVDLLGRAKLVREAEKFIKEMPIEPDAIVWRSLIFACGANGDVEVAEFAAQKIVELEPRRCGTHVMLSNIYASTSMWGDANRVRGAMASSSIRKQPGCSFVEIDGVVHEFFSADASYEQTEIIHGLLKGLNAQFSDHI